MFNSTTPTQMVNFTAQMSPTPTGRVTTFASRPERTPGPGAVSHRTTRGWSITSAFCEKVLTLNGPDLWEGYAGPDSVQSSPNGVGQGTPAACCAAWRDAVNAGCYDGGVGVAYLFEDRVTILRNYYNSDHGGGFGDIWRETWGTMGAVAQDFILEQQVGTYNDCGWTDVPADRLTSFCPMVNTMPNGLGFNVGTVVRFKYDGGARGPWWRGFVTQNRRTQNGYVTVTLTDVPEAARLALALATGGTASVGDSYDVPYPGWSIFIASCKDGTDCASGETCGGSVEDEFRRCECYGCGA